MKRINRDIYCLTDLRIFDCDNYHDDTLRRAICAFLHIAKTAAQMATELQKVLINSQFLFINCFSLIQNNQILPSRRGMLLNMTLKLTLQRRLQKIPQPERLQQQELDKREMQKHKDVSLEIQQGSENIIHLMQKSLNKC